MLASCTPRSAIYVLSYHIVQLILYVFSRFKIRKMCDCHDFEECIRIYVTSHLGHVLRLCVLGLAEGLDAL